MRTTLMRISVCAMMIALAIILCRQLGFPQTGAYRVEISFLPIAVVAMMMGPIWAGVSYGLADLIGAAEKNSSLILICGSLYLYKDRF